MIRLVGKVLIRVQLGYKGHFWQIKNPANIDLQGILRAAPTGFEFVDFGFMIRCHLRRSVYLQRFPPSFIMIYNAVLQAN